MNSRLIQFKEFLKENRGKFTSARQEVLKEILSQRGHPEAEEIYYSLKNKGKKVSRATVYRTLELLVKSGLVKKLYTGENHLHYEKCIEKRKHSHLVCLSCGKVIEFHSKKLEQFQKEISTKKVFQIKEPSLQIYGYCRDCQKKEDEESN
jgi:Fur family ferric uptake transcriptional regulator